MTGKAVITRAKPTATIMPAANPWIALNTISIQIFCEEPHSMEATVKAARPYRKTLL